MTIEGLNTYGPTLSAETQWERVAQVAQDLTVRWGRLPNNREIVAASHASGLDEPGVPGSARKWVSDMNEWRRRFPRRTGAPI